MELNRNTKLKLFPDMASGDERRKLHALVKDSYIRQKTQSDTWPSAHSSTFSTIHDLSKKTLKDYYNNVEQMTSNAPWKRENMNRAQWLVKQASELSRNSANESTWRMRIENAILEPFSIEVAWSAYIESSHIDRWLADDTFEAPNAITDSGDRR